MRRRRHTLQVSTFPFLAVLLCAMGSLILLLLVLDRRAKVVARAKTRAQQEAVLALQSKAERDRLRDFEQKRDLLRRQLREQEASLHASLDSLQSQIQKKKQESLQERGRTLELQTRLAALRQVLAREQEGYEQAQRQNATVVARKTRLLTEHEGLTREVVNLERALADVIAFRKRQAQTYSLVPYRGKSGDNRRPVYIECQGDQLIVHPERTIVKTGSWDGSNQLQALADKMKARLEANAAESKQKPYVLFLVRPDGIATYYQTLAALGVRNVDSGYELIDADWALDFGEEGGHAPAQPWMADSTPAAATVPAAGIGAIPGGKRISGPVRGVRQEDTDMFSSKGPVTTPSPGPPSSATGMNQIGSDGSRGMASLASPGSIGNRNGTAGFGPKREVMPANAGQGFSGGGLGPGIANGNNGPMTSGNFSGAGSGTGGGLGSDIANSNNGPMTSSNFSGVGSRTGGPGGGNAPTTLGDLLNRGNVANARGSATGTGNSATNQGNGTTAGSGSNAVPGSGVGMPAWPGAGAGPRVNSGDSQVAFTPSDKPGIGGGSDEQKLLPLPGQSGMPGGTGTGLKLGAPTPNTEGASDPVIADGANGERLQGPGGSGGSPGFGPASSGAGIGSSGSAHATAGVPGESDPTGAVAPPFRETRGTGAGGASSDPGASSLQGAAGSPQAASGAAGAGQSSGVPSIVINGEKPQQTNPEQGGDPNGASPAGSSAGGSSGSAGGSAGAAGDASGEAGSGAGTPAPPDPLAHMRPRTKRPSPPPSFRAEGNRDLPILLECKGNQIVFSATGRTWQVAELERDARARDGFADAIKQWIARRQESVREGQTPYRPLVRFRVDPDGVRTYYAAYPLLEKLGCPMRRENVEALPPPAPRMRP